MGIYISRVQIQNFRNFKNLDVCFSNKVVMLGANKAGKTNLIHALRLILDPDLPDSARNLREEDFWEGLEDPMENGEEIVIAIEIQGFEDSENMLSILTDSCINDNPPTAKVTYKFSQIPNLSEGRSDDAKYEFTIYGGDDPANNFGYQERRWMPLQVLPALRDAERDLESWRRSPLRPLIDRLEVQREQVEEASQKINEAMDSLTEIDDIRELSEDIEQRLEDMVGEFHSVSPTLGVASTDARKLIKSLRLFVNGDKKRNISETSLGICNVIYLSLLLLELERKEARNERATTFLAIEEPEAHLHPHLQRLVYKDFLERDSFVVLTTHSPHIASVSPLGSLVIVKDCGEQDGSKAFSTAETDFSEQEKQDLERYLDATKAEILFSEGVVLVEGDAELYVVPAAAEQMKLSLDERNISICSVHGIDFKPYVRLLCDNSLNIPFVIITDGDPYTKGGKIHYLGELRAYKILESLAHSELKTLKELLEKREWDKMDEIFVKEGIFVGHNTLEIDLAISGNEGEMIEALQELGAGPIRIKKFRDALKDKDIEQQNSEANSSVNYILKSIERYGKGRFAQRLSSKLRTDSVPEYVRDAIKYICGIV